MQRKIGGLSTSRTWLRLGAVATSIAAACQFSHGRLPTDGNPGDGVSDGGVCAALSSECVGDSLRVCTAIGMPPTDFPCGWGCVPGAAAHCAHVVPSGSGGDANNGVRPSDVAGDDLLDVTLGDGVTIDSDNGRIGTGANANLHHTANTGIENGIDFQLRGPIGMFRFKSLSIAGTITIVGRRPIALVADRAITINGVVDARGLCSANIGGPGGFNGGTPQGQPGLAPAATTAGGPGAESASTGGGGGGHGTGGGSAKDVAAGGTFGDAAISTLVGGAGGGAGSGGMMFGRGGGGGGAVQLISNVKVEVATGGINAGGCGGLSGEGGNDSGGGGGAGGAILIEAPLVTIAGALAVNGGAGGGGGGGNASPGAKATLDRTPAAAGDGDATDEGGGSGAAGAAGAGSGEGGSNPGGGGGGIGRIRINTRNGTGATLTGATLSPSPDDPNTTFSTGSAVAQ